MRECWKRVGQRAKRAADQGQRQQGALRDTRLVAFGLALVPAEGEEGDDVDAE
jgi:hypothetical protein